MTRRAIIIDDEESVCWALGRALRSEGYETAVAASAEEGLRLIADRPPDVAFLDVRLPGMDGVTALERIRHLHASVPVVIMTAFGDLATAVRALKGGAFDYLVKPFDLAQALRTAQNAQHLRSSTPTALNIGFNTDEEMVGQSAVMQGVFKRIAMVAPHSACVLITGESGVGKELVARALHRHSSRSSGAFLPAHAAALNPALVESELFGHVRGAFIGADDDRVGLLARAQRGTVFLDEVAELPLTVQVKLLRALELGEVLPVGGDEPLRLDFRIIAATNCDLEALVADGKFRRDLFFRLNGFRIHLPALRERLDDIPVLTRHFLNQLAPDSPPLPPATLVYLQQQKWPGNVREFRNALERASIVARGGPLLPEHFHEPYSACAGGDDHLSLAVRQWLRQLLAANPKITNLTAELQNIIEPVLIDEVLRRTRGNRSLAAEWLGLDRATVRKRIQQYGLESDPTEG